MDVFRVVCIGRSGRPMPLMNLAVPQGDIWWIRGSFKIGSHSPTTVTPAPSRPRQVAQSRGRTDVASSVSATWRVKGATADEAIARLERLFAFVDSGRDNRYLEWRPEGAVASAFMRILGPGSYTPLYDWAQFQGSSDGAAVQIEVSWPVDPFSYGAPWDVEEDWTPPPFDPVGYTNLVVNPRAAIDLRGGALAGGFGGTLTRDTSWPTNETSYRVAGTTTGTGQFPGLAIQSTSVTYPVEPGERMSYTVQYKINDRPGTQTSMVTLLRCYKPNGTNVDIGSTSTTISADGQTGTVSVQGLTVPAGTVHMGWYFYMANTGASDTFDFQWTKIMIVKSATLPTVGFADGDTDGWGWQGQAHYSKSQELVEGNLAEWTVDLDTALSAVRGPTELVFESPTTTEFRARHTGRNTGPRINDEAEVLYQISATSQTYLIISAGADGNTFLSTGVDSGGVLRIWRHTDGTTITALGTTSAVTPTAGALHKLRFSREGNTCTGTLFDKDGITSLGTAVATLTGSDANAFAPGGDAGLRVAGTNMQATRVHVWRRRPLTWRLSNSYDLPDTFTIRNLPGTSDGPSHLADVSLQPVTQTSAFAFGLVSWTAVRGVENYIWNGDFEIDALGWAAGGGGPDGGTVVAGVSTGTTVTKIASAFCKFGAGLGLVTGDGQAASQAGSFKMYRRFRRGQVYTAMFWHRQRASVLQVPVGVAAALVAGGTLPVQAFFYKVEALNASGETTPSAEVTATTAGGNLTIRITWTAVVGATGYRIFRSNTGTGNEDESFDVGAVTTFDDTGAITWVADTTVVTSTATVVSVTQAALGFDSTDRTLSTITPGAANALGVIEWTPSADRDLASFAIVVNGTVGQAVTIDLDGVMVFEGTAPPREMGAIQGRGAFRPFGRIGARNDYRTARVGAWTATGTNRIGPTSSLAVGGGVLSVDYLVDPFLLDPPVDERDPVIEVYTHGTLTTGVNEPRFNLSVLALDVTAARQYSQPFGATGRLVTNPTVTAERTWRLGQVTLDRDLAATGRLALRVEFSWTSATGLPTLDLEYLLLVPVDGVASGPTGKAAGVTYPNVVPAQGSGLEPNVRTIRSDLTGLLVGATSGRGTVDSSFGGEPIQLPPGGDVLLATYLTSGVPDDPTSDSHADTDAVGVTIHVGVTPRHNLVPPGR